MRSRQEIGKIGEDIASKFLMEREHRIIARNYRKFYGEIDIISQKDGITYFVEVKAREIYSVSRGTDEYLPEEHVHQKKMERIAKTVQIYIDEQNYDGEWEFMILAVDIYGEKKQAHVRQVRDVL
jgi:putative endonuclease